MMADAARYNVDHGAQIIDINMGCPAKKVCNAWAGSALMRDEPLVARILEAVVQRGRRAGDAEDPHRLGRRQPQRAVRSRASPRTRGIAALAVHGRTRDQQYAGERRVRHHRRRSRRCCRIPVIANGDIDSPQKAACVLRHTGADAVMIGRAAQGRPWIFREIAHLPRHRRAAAAAVAGRGPRHPARRTCSACTRSTASPPACASRASTWAGTRRTGRRTRPSAPWSIAPKPRDAQLRLTRDYFDALIAGDAAELQAVA